MFFGTTLGNGVIQANFTHILRDIVRIGSAPLPEVVV